MPFGFYEVDGEDLEGDEPEREGSQVSRHLAAVGGWQVCRGWLVVHRRGTLAVPAGESLVPGGTIVVLGGTGDHYRDIYPQLDQSARVARLKIVGGFDQPLQAGHRPDELAAIRTLTRDIWNGLEALAGDVSQIKDELRQHGAADIFDESVSFTLPRFRIRAYRRGK